MKPQIAILHVNTIPSGEFDEFRRVLSAPNLDVQVVEVEQPGPMAALEWLTPTLVLGFVASSYFGGFLQEMGKDHYLLLKEQFKKLYPKVAGPEAPDVELLGSPGKVKSVQPYSLYFSLVGEGPNGSSIKLLLKRPIERLEYEQSVDLFLEYLQRVNAGTLSEAEQRRLQSIRPMGRTILVVLDEVVGEVVPVDPRTGELVR